MIVVVILTILCRMVSRCLCLNKRLNRRRTGTVVGTSCMCRENRAREEEVARAAPPGNRRKEGIVFFNNNMKLLRFMLYKITI